MMQTRAHDFGAKLEDYGDWRITYGEVQIFLDQYGQLQTVHGALDPRDMAQALRRPISEAVASYIMDGNPGTFQYRGRDKERVVRYIAEKLNARWPKENVRD